MTDWAKQKVVGLRAELKRRGLPQNGLKGELVARLETADNKPEQPEEEAEEQQQQQQPDEVGAESAEVAPEPLSTQPESPVANHDPPEEQPDAGGEHRIASPAPAKALDGAPDGAENPKPQSESGAGHGGEVLAENVLENLPDNLPEQLPEQLPAGETESPPSPTQKDTWNDLPPCAAPDSQKRKRNSPSPPPTEAVARKRARADDDANETDLAAVGAMDIVQEHVDEKDNLRLDSYKAAADSESYPRDMGYERDGAPPLHPVTSALYIGNLMRPLRADDIRTHLAHLASTSPSDSADNLIVKFYLDQIRTHAFAIFSSPTAASRVRAALHDCVWPNESNRKPLLVDFVPPGMVDEWIDLEESNAGGRSGSRWEVVYRDGPDGDIKACLESGIASTSVPGPPPPPPPSNRPPNLSHGNANAIPIGPRGHREMGPPPTGPRAVRPGAGPGPRPPPSFLDHVVERTRTSPVITYQLVSGDLARRRIDNMRSFYTRDTHRDLGREINRYSFENGDSFVDRGKEVFEGIRPPHRDRNNRDRRGGGRGGGGGFGGRPPRRGPPPPPFRPRSDRYLPGFGGGDGGSWRDDRRPRYDNDERSYADERPSRYIDDRFSRHANDRDRDHRDRRY